MMAFGRSSIRVRPATDADLDVLAEIHADSFRRGWSEEEFDDLLRQPRMHALVAEHRGALGRVTKAGFILYRIAADEAEVISVAVCQACRRRGVARKLIEEALRHLYSERVADLHLEVEEGNNAAISLYRSLEFEETGRRPDYYRQGQMAARGALVMRRKVR
ncbi:ribosomal-protein-alanine N-acetyltransferase [Faunimonas pinastri]|uniref:Ribosomal-protein-alanine N-acetyltransferase n=1 Tax=Faunimonas pinastri TaxID=1855383 RepID=A0A1H9PR28_9HYPH|nr:GNAT family N-acetyltransferase [Faunimonas pinastri]SER50540.1 ribosomal-protein-alanine N-acetyltransferase [Faunimonas pinastri]